MRIVFMGTPDFAAGVLKALIEAGEAPVLVVTQPDRKRGRGRELSVCDTARLAREKNIPVFQPERVKRPEAVEEIARARPELIIVAAFGQILPPEILNLPEHGCVNVHASLLPKYRGASPIQRAIADGEKKTGVTLMQMDEGLDTGDILLQEELIISPEDTGGSLFEKLSGLGAALMVRALPLIEAGKLKRTKQDEALASYAGMIKKEDGRLDFAALSAVEAERLVRAYNPWPGTYTVYQGKVLKLWGAEVTEENSPGDMRPGTVTKAGKDELIISCAEGSLKVTELQLEGKRRMNTGDFLKGTKISVGEFMG
ncbi:MAG: methionyl-tRNA formyltransferase [Lachnospiraceae bacterium]|nr:methionyl-tRNA formyltransferase [Lachnospiraceae bacterium]